MIIKFVTRSGRVEYAQTEGKVRELLRRGGVPLGRLREIPPPRAEGEKGDWGRQSLFRGTTPISPKGRGR